MTRLPFLIIASFLLAVCTIHAASDDLRTSYSEGPDSVVVVPGAHYQAGALHRLLFGSHWRDFWTIPVKVPVLDLDTYAGGLTPLRKGGGQQTKSLKFTGADGRIYKFRSVDKDPTRILPEALQRTLVADVLRDQVSSANPMAPLVAVPLLRAVDVLQAEPKLVHLPDSPALGEFQEEYGGLLGMIELHPDEYDPATPAFAGAEKVVGTYKMFDKLDKHADDQPDAREYLKARSMDLLMGDWDRHYDQWRWAAFVRADTTYWKPIPRDRDQVFARFNGILPWMASIIVPQLNHFDETYQDVVDYTWSGRYLDRRILPRLEWHTWDSIATLVQHRITDSVIREAVSRLPREHYEAGGEELYRTLQLRRDDLHRYMHEYYALLAEEVDIYGTNDRDKAVVDRLDDIRVTVSIYSMDGEGKKNSPYFRRTFRSDETYDIRIYLGDDDDSVIVNGDVASSIPVRIVGGNGADTFVDSGYVHGYALGVLPFIPDAEPQSYFYDSGKKSTFVEGPGTCIDKTKVDEPETDAEKYEPPRDWGYSSFNVPYMSYSTDLALLLKYHHYRTYYSFRNKGFDRSYNIGLGYAPITSRFDASFEATFNNTPIQTPVLFSTSVSTMDILHYYGPGNETVRIDALEHIDYFDVNHFQWNVFAGIRPLETKRVHADIGIGYKRVEHWDNQNHLVDVAQPYGTGRFDLVYGAISTGLDYRDNRQYPRSGVLLLGQALYSPALLDVSEPYGVASIEGRTYFTSHVITEVTVALRGRAERVFYHSHYPYFMSAYLGGKTTLRGFRTQRFGGDASLLGGAEVRIPLGTVKVIIPALFGMSAYAESGQIHMRGVQSDVWHTGFGVGVWATVAEPEVTVSLSVARSVERYGVYATVGFPW